MSPDQILAEAAKTFAERGKVYGESYKQYGQIMHALFPHGIVIKTAEDFNRFALFFHCVNKLQRYAKNIMGGGHLDSARDLCVYAAMLESMTLPKGVTPPSDRASSDTFNLEKQNGN